MLQQNTYRKPVLGFENQTLKNGIVPPSEEIGNTVFSSSNFKNVNNFETVRDTARLRPTIECYQKTDENLSESAICFHKIRPVVEKLKLVTLNWF